MAIYKRNKFYYIDFYHNGKRIRINTHTARKDIAKLFESDLRLKLLRQDLNIGEGKIKLFDIIHQYLEYTKINNSPATYIRDEISLRNFSDFAGNFYISNLTPKLMEEYKTYRYKTAAVKTINTEITTIKAMMNKAVEWKIISKNPIASVKKIRGPKSKTIRFLDKDEIKQLLKYATSTMYPIIYTFIKTGMRKSELINLEWTDIDFKYKRIKAINKEDYHPKGYKERQVPIDNQLINVLKNIKRNVNSTYVFCTKDGKIRINNLLRELKRIAKRAGVKNVTIHALRHTFASHLVMAGVDLVTIQQLMGHSDIKTTMIYSHLDPEHLKGAVEKLQF